MSSSYIMILFGIILLWNEALITSGQPLGMEDYYNLIEPKDNNNIWIKPRGKVNMKNLILSIKKIEAKQKQYWNMNDVKTETDSKTTQEITSEPTTSERIITIPTTTIYYDNPPRIPSLHEQKETDQKRFYHSILDGWVY
uniref:Putative secreted protein n=1 Tax=Panstrongylus lignarius TaxID=156445 RepID=A0A224XNK5_9HEMI